MALAALQGFQHLVIAGVTQELAARLHSAASETTGGDVLRQVDVNFHPGPSRIRLIKSLTGPPRLRIAALWASASLS